MAGSGLRFNRWVYYVCALVHVLSCAGAVFGWANIAYILQKEGAFSANCPKVDGLATCSDQTLQLSNLYSTASVFAFCIPAVSGLFQDRYGPRTTVRILSLIFAIGILLLLGAATTNNAVLYYPAFAALGTAASANLLPLYSVATLFPANRALALSTLSGAFDAGTIVFFIWARLYDQGWPLRQVLIAYLAGPVAVQLLMALFLWPEKPFDSYDTGSDPSTGVSSPSVAPGQSQAEDGVSSASASNAGSNATGGTRAGVMTRTGSHSSLGAARKPSSSVGSVGVSGGELHSPTSSLPGSGSLSIRKVPSLQEAMSSAVSAVMGASPRTPYHKLRVAGQAEGGEGGGGREENDEVENDEVEIDLAPPALTLPPTNSASAAAQTLEKGRSSRSTGMLQPQGSAHLPPVPEVTAGYREDEIVAPAPEDLRKAQAGIECRSPFMPAVNTAFFTSLPFGKQLTTPIYLAYLVFFICCIVRFNFYISSVGAQLDAIGQAEAFPGGEAPYSQAFGYILPCGLFFNIAIGTLLDRYGPVLGLATLWLLAILLSILAMIPVLQLQVFTFIVFTAYRGLNFCVMTVFLSAIFGFKTLGSLVGVLTAVAGVIGLVNSALLSWALANPQGPAQFLQPNAFLLGLMLLCGLFPMWLARRTGVGSLLQAFRTGGKARS